MEDEILGYSYITYILREDFHFIIVGEIFRGRIIEVIPEFLLGDLKIFINGYPLWSSVLWIRSFRNVVALVLYIRSLVTS